MTQDFGAFLINCCSIKKNSPARNKPITPQNVMTEIRFNRDEKPFSTVVTQTEIILYSMNTNKKKE